VKSSKQAIAIGLSEARKKGCQGTEKEIQLGTQTVSSGSLSIALNVHRISGRTLTGLCRSFWLIQHPARGGRCLDGSRILIDFATPESTAGLPTIRELMATSPFHRTEPHLR